MKLNTAAHILLTGPLLAILYLPMPAQAAVQLIPPVNPASSPGLPHSTSFYQQQRDKLKYTPNAESLSTDFLFLRKKSEPAQQKQNLPNPDNIGLNKNQQSEPSAAIDATKKSRARKNRARNRRTQIQKTKQQTIKSNSELNAEKSSTIDLKEKQNSKPSIQARIRQQMQPQKQSDTKDKLPSLSTRRDNRKDPYAILDAARNKHSDLQGRHLDSNPFRTDQPTYKINFRTPDFTSLKQQVPEKINQLKSDIRSHIQQRPEQLKQTFITAKADLQQRSADSMSGPLAKAQTFMQHNIKEPLSRLLRKIGIAVQKTADQLR